MTILAIEQGILGIYDTKVECDFHDGSRTLCKFELTARKPTVRRSKTAKAIPHVRSTYETLEDGSSSDLEDYETSGMVRRKTKGGYDFHKPWGVDRALIF